MPVTFKPGERTYTNSSQEVWQVLNTVWKQIKIEFPTTMKSKMWVFLDDMMCSTGWDCGVKSQNTAVSMRAGHIKATQLISW